MKTLTQIAHELGYKTYSSVYDKLAKKGVDIRSLERFVGGHNNTTKLYDEASEKYIKSIVGPCRNQKPTPVVDSAKDLSSKSIQSTTKKVEKKATPVKTKKVMKSKVSAPKAAKADKVQAASPITTTVPASQVNLDHRLQQLQVLGEVLVAQINQLTSEVSSQKKIPVQQATYVAS